MLRMKFEPQFIDIWEIHARRFGMGSRVVGFESDDDFLNFLRGNYYKLPVSSSDSSSSSSSSAMFAESK